MSEAYASEASALEAACLVLDDAIACVASGGPPVPIGPNDIKVLRAPEGRPMVFDEVGDDFYQISAAEAKALMDMAAAKRAESEAFKTKETRDAEAAATFLPASCLQGFCQVEHSWAGGKNEEARC